MKTLILRTYTYAFVAYDFMLQLSY